MVFIMLSYVKQPKLLSYFCNKGRLPPIHTHVAEYDGVRSQTKALVKKLDETKVIVYHHVIAG